MTRDEFLSFYPDYPVWKQLVYDHYGRICMCCGARHDLTIDHVNGDGAAERKQYGRSWYKHIIDLGFPSYYQTLCRVCNSSKGTGTQCRRHLQGVI